MTFIPPAPSKPSPPRPILSYNVYNEEGDLLFTVECDRMLVNELGLKVFYLDCKDSPVCVAPQSCFVRQVVKKEPVNQATLHFNLNLDEA